LEAAIEGKTVGSRAVGALAPYAAGFESWLADRGTRRSRSDIGYGSWSWSLPLRWAVPRVADPRDSSLARGLDPAAVAKLLASCDRRHTVGRRNYAILLLCWRLGLRAGEVAALRLEDIGWRTGELLVRGKGDRHERLPLAVDVGAALVSYLRRRPRSTCRTVFVTAIAPVGPLSGKAIWGVVHAACLRAGIAPVGPHALRHTAATGMLLSDTLSGDAGGG
jgi:integrase